jgi:hypothetical protein
MSGGYEVVLSALEKAAGAAKRSAAGVRPVDLASTLAGIGPGLTGGTSGEAARLLADKWGRDLPAWVKNMGEYSAQLTVAVQRYRSNEQAAEHDLRAAATRGGPRPI